MRSPVSTSGYSLTQNGVLLLSEVGVPQVGGELAFACFEFTLRIDVVGGFAGVFVRYTCCLLRCAAT